MNKAIALCKREWLEHRAGFALGPLIVLGIVIFSSVVALLVNDQVALTLDASDQRVLEERVEGGDDSQASALNMVAAMAFDIAGSTDEELEARLDLMLNALAVPFHWVLFAVTVFALVSCLYDERKDHSVLFWKSMPASDLETVAAKCVFMIWLAPVVTIAAVFVAQFAAVAMSAAFVEDGMGGRVWAASGLWLRPFELALGYVLFGFWALPVYGWLLFVSSFVSRAPVLVALGAPLGVMFLESTLAGTQHIGQFIGAHISPVSLPASGIEAPGGPGPLGVVRLGTFWIGLLLGFVFLAGAVYLRRRNNEI